MHDGQTLKRFVIASLVVHAIALAYSARMSLGYMKPPEARVIDVQVLSPKRSAPKVASLPKPAPAAKKPAPEPKKPPEAKKPEQPKKSVEAKKPDATPRQGAPKPAPVKPAAPPKPTLRDVGKPALAAGPKEVKIARASLPDQDLLGLRRVPRAPGSGTPAGPGRNPRDETPSGSPGGGPRFGKVRPGFSAPNEQLSSTPEMPGGFGAGVREPLPRGVPIGRRDAGVSPDPDLVSRHVGGGSPAIGSGSDRLGGPRTDRAPETVYMHGGAGGTHLPKAMPRIGGGGGEFTIATGPSSSDVAVRVSPKPGIGPGMGGGAGAGIGGGYGMGRGKGFGVGMGTVDRGLMNRKPGAGIGAGKGGGIGTGTWGNGHEPGGGDIPGTGGRLGMGYGSGSGYGIGSGKGGGKARPGMPGIPYGDLGGAIAGGNPNGGGGKGGGPGGPGKGIQVARAGGGGPGTGAGGPGDSGLGPWAGRGRGRGAGGRGIGPGNGTGTGTGPGKHPGSGSGPGGKGTELPGAGEAGAGGSGSRSRIRLANYGKAIPGANEEWDEELIGRGFYPDGIVGKYYNDPVETVDHAHPETYLNKPIRPGTAFVHLVGRRMDKTIDFNWNPNGEWGDWNALKSPMPGVQKTYWSCQWEGQLFVPKDGTYSFKFDPVDDAGRVYLQFRQGGPMECIINSWVINKAYTASKDYDMKKGIYNIRVDYAQRPEFYACVTLKWKSDSFGWEVIGPYKSGGVRQRHRRR